MENPVAIIFAAGKGERLTKYTSYYQKCCLPVNGKPLLVYWLDALWNQQTHVYINVFYGHHSQQVIDVAQTWERQLILPNNPDSEIPQYERGVNLVYMPPRDKMWQDIQQFYAIHAYLKHRPLLLCYGDNYSPYLQDIIAKFLDNQSLLGDETWGIIGLIPVANCSKATEEAILGFRKESGLYEVLDYQFAQEGVPLGSFAFAGIGLFSPKALEMTEYGVTNEAIARLARERKLLGHIIQDNYFDIGTPEKYARVLPGVG